MSCNISQSYVRPCSHNLSSGSCYGQPDITIHCAKMNITQVDIREPDYGFLNYVQQGVQSTARFIFDFATCAWRSMFGDLHLTRIITDNVKVFLRNNIWAYVQGDLGLFQHIVDSFEKILNNNVLLQNANLVCICLQAAIYIINRA
eukprot:6470997-Amphidinium_carterae.1